MYLREGDYQRPAHDPVKAFDSLGLSVLGIRDVHASDEASEGLQAAREVSKSNHRRGTEVAQTPAKSHTGTYSDTVTLSDTENRGVNVSSSGLESAVGVGDGFGRKSSALERLKRCGSALTASRVIVEVALDVARDDTTKRSDEVVDLARVGASNSVGNSDTVDTDLVNSTVDGEKVD